ncbi:unnamed protein product [Sphagnum jensenii]|uniref:Calcium-transporting P-type ATPase N-terminal autoinhibitory domain-containing protein n=1 Tax=Sphagnum jensenii TaxID=128206 RepID=A0ABP1BJQ9_9BRYO
MCVPPSEIRRKDDGNPREKALENDDGNDDNPFIIDAKHPIIERLKKWWQATLTVNATQWFRYTLDLKKLEERTRFTSPAAHLRAGTHAIQFAEARLKMLLQHFVQTWRMASVTHWRRYRREKRHLGIKHIPKSNQRAFW